MAAFCKSHSKLCVKEQFLSLVITVTREFDIGYLSVRLSVCPMLQLKVMDLTDGGKGLPIDTIPALVRWTAMLQQSSRSAC